MQFAMTAAILGIAAVFVVPMVSGLLGGFVPADYKSYIPSASSPAFSSDKAQGRWKALDAARFSAGLGQARVSRQRNGASGYWFE